MTDRQTPYVLLANTLGALQAMLPTAPGALGPAAGWSRRRWWRSGSPADSDRRAMS